MDRYNKIIELLNNDYVVLLTTYGGKSLKLTKKYISIISYKNDQLYVRDINYTYCRITAYKIKQNR